ncbi:MAG: ATP-binding protein, partial [Acidobacteriota bacterium]
LSALGGRPVSKISSLDEPENEFERVRFTELQETYAPLRELGSGKIIGAVEFYEKTAPLRKELWEARLQSWMIVIGATVIMYVLLLGMVGTASRTISKQRTKLARSEAQHELDRMKAEFTSAISHEFRTPLGFIKGYSTTLLRDDISVEPETRREFLQIISDESDKLNRMFSDLLDASRIQAERFDVDRREVALSQLLEEATAKARPKVQESRFELEVSISLDGVRVYVDPDRVEQVVHNLIENACQYSNPGTVIEVVATSSGQEATISVRDHGDGIPAEEIEKVFDAFYRGDNARRRRTSGTGLGLAVCRTIVEAHGGTIRANNTPDAGAIVSFTLPVLS